jgi:hypothetical protein
MKCIHAVNFKEKDFEETIATTPEEITKTWERRAGKIR